jgi:hypothetical protein
VFGEPRDIAVGEPDAPMRRCRPRLAADVIETVERDLTGTAIELLKDV